jgi:hypothetical protein
MKNKWLLGCAVVTAGFALVSCSTSRSPSGFLANFDQLNAGYGTEDAVASFVAPDANIRAYHSLMIDPVTTVIANPAVSPQASEQIASYVLDALHNEFRQHIAIATAPGPGVMRLRAALTDVISGYPVEGKPVTTRHGHPQATFSGNIGDDALAAFISKVSFEYEVVDSVSGKRLVALVDHRLGNKREATAETSWAAIRSGANVGAKKIVQRYTYARDR